MHGEEVRRTADGRTYDGRMNEQTDNRRTDEGGMNGRSKPWASYPSSVRRRIRCKISYSVKFSMTFVLGDLCSQWSFPTSTRIFGRSVNCNFFNEYAPHPRYANDSASGILERDHPCWRSLSLIGIINPSVFAASHLLHRRQNKS